MARLKIVHIEDKYTSVKQLIELGKEKGYLLYDEIYEMLPDEVIGLPAELDEIYLRFDELKIVVIDRPERYHNRDDVEAAPIDFDKKESEEPRGLRGRRAREDQRPGAHVPARDGHGPAARPRGRGRDRAAHRAGRVDDLRGAVREPAGAARAAAPERAGAEGQEGAARAGRRATIPTSRSIPRPPTASSGNLTHLRADRQARPRDPEAQAPADKYKDGRRAVTRSSSARSTACVGKIAKDIRSIDFSRPDAQPPGRLPEGHRPRSSRARAGHPPRPGPRSRRRRTRSCATCSSGASRSTAAHRGASRSATAPRIAGRHARSRRSARARRCASAPRRS